jgi:activator of 2-hydroxyglutaryl-CoA dehydratase
MSYAAGVDVGSTQTKAVIINSKKSVPMTIPIRP